MVQIEALATRFDPAEVVSGAFLGGVARASIFGPD